MKLRIKGDSIRLRLLRPEVEALIAGGVVRELTHLPPGEAFGYELRCDPRAAAVSARFEGGCIRVVVPEARARAWGGSDEVDIRAEQPIAEGRLMILIEKDFPCLTDRPFEDDRGAFPRDQLRVET
jgi:hypothetical protein